MARGKHKARAANRRASYTETLLVQLRSELDMERAALSEAGKTLDQITRLQSQLKAENVALLDEVTPYAEQLRQERDFLRSVSADLGLHRARIKDTWERYMSAAIDMAPGATYLEQAESVFRTTGLNGFLDDEAHLKVKNRNAESITRLQRARGERRNVAEKSTPEEERALRLQRVLDTTGPALMRPSIRQLLLDQDVVYIGEDGKHHLRDSDELTKDQNTIKVEAISVAQRLWESRAGGLDADGVHVWGSGNLISTDNEPEDIRLALGFTPKEQDQGIRSVMALGLSTGLPLPSMPATSRDAITRQSAEDALGAWRGVFESRRLIIERLGLKSHPFAPLAHHPQPSQGIAVQNSYAMAAFSRWVHQGAESQYAPAAVGLTAAATYWLPAGQTASFAESEPMDESDRAEMILPFPQVFLAFAEPLVLEPAMSATSKTQESWRVLSEIAHDVYRDNKTAGHVAEERSQLAEENTGVAPTIDELISECGAHIEGVLLLADSLGRPEDRFAWCLAIPGVYGSTLGRFVIPSLRSATEYRDAVDNLTAVVAWAQWHEPDESTAVPLVISAEDLESYISSKDFQRNAKRAGAGIRVIDVGSTHRRAGSPRPSADEGSDIQVTPHIRRGHWRRQRFGQGREQIKRIRIAPVLVNAHRGDIAPRVYRLRRNT